MNTLLKYKNKTASAILLFLILVLLLPVNTFAADVLWDSYEVPSTRQKERLLDNADLLSDSEEADLLRKLDSLSEQWSCNIVVLTVDSHNGPIQDYADDYFDYNGFGTDYNSGILFMLSMADREWAIGTYGSAIQTFTDYGQSRMMDNMMPYLRDGDYSGAFNAYAETCDYYLALDEEGEAYDVGYQEPRTSADIVRMLLISIVIGLVVALFPVLRMKSQLKTVKTATNAANYEAKGGMKLNVNRDTFVRTQVTKAPIPKDTDSGSRGSSFGGGSSTHTSSSGSSHGGSHGHF